MPPRIPVPSLLRTCPYASPPTTQFRPLLLAMQSLSLSTSAPLHGNNDTRRFDLRRHDPYALAKAKKRKEANLQRQRELTEQRTANAADPILGNPTPFTESLKNIPTPLPPIDAISTGAVTPQQLQQQRDEARLNHFLKKNELEEFLENSKKITFPPTHRDIVAPLESDKELKRLAKHESSVEAVKRITSLALGSAKDRTRENKQYCIDTFGRHVTDTTLPSDPIRPSDLNKPRPFTKTPRVGRDTGSSEVQAAILTTKILALAEHVRNNKKDKTNKRNLRLLLHKRQKHLKYLKRKEKGGVRYRNILEALGLDEEAIGKELML